MTKIKVSREVAKAIEFQLKVKNHDIDRLIASHASHKLGRGHFMNRSAILDEMSVSQFASVLINGYKVEETPEEKWSKIYHKICSSYDDGIYRCRDRELTRVKIIEEMAKDFGLKIEGVNA